MSTFSGIRGESNFTLGPATYSQLTLTTAASKIIPGATSLSLRNNADSADNLIITNAGAVTIRAGLTVTAGGATVTAGDLTMTAGNLIFSSASGKVIPGATSLLFRNTADSATNITITDAGAVTVRTTLTATGGIAAAGGFSTSPRNMHTGGIPATQTTDGNDTMPVITETYIAELWVAANVSATGVAVFNGSAVGTDKLVLAIFDSTGAVVANTATAGTTATGTDAYQKINLTAPVTLKGPATYYVGLQVNGTTYRFNSHILGGFGASKKTGETFGTLTAVTPPTTFTTALGPMASLY